ncbi:MAG: sugar ABC transporter permease [Clostridia bacterium]
MMKAAAVGKGKPINPSLRARKRTFFFFSFPAAFLYSLFFIFPVGMGLYYSMTDWDGIAKNINFIGLENYTKLLSNKRFLNAMLFNLRYTILLTIFIVVLGVILALLLNSKVKGITFFRATFFLPAVLAGVTVALIFNQIFYRAIPPIGQALGIPWLSNNILSSKDTAMYGILFVNIWQGVAMPTILFLAGLQSIPQELQEAAAIDGANAWNRFRFITVPFLLPVLTVVMVLTIKSGLMVFDYIVSLTDGGPARSTESVAILIYAHAFKENKFSYSSAEAIVVGLIVAAISAVQIFFTNRKKV